MKSILLSGYYGFGNLGDELLLRNISRLLGNLGFTSIYAVSGNIKYSNSKHENITFVSRNDYPVIVNIIRQMDLVALGGGGLFQDHDRLTAAGFFENPQNGVHSYINIPLIAHIYKKPVAYLFQGVGPLFSEDSRSFTKYAYSLSDYTSVRDYDSERLLKDLGVGNVVLSGDPAFLYPVENVKTSVRKPKIGISLRQWVDKSVEGSIITAFRDFLNATDNVDFYFISFHDSDRKMRSKLKVKKDITLIRSEDHSLEDIEKMIAGLDFLIGMRLHSIVLAIKYGIPFIAVPYCQKVDSLLKDTALEDASIGVEEISGGKIRDRFISFISEASDIKMRIEKGMAIIEQRLQYGIDTMKGFLPNISKSNLISLPVEKPDEKSSFLQRFLK